MSGKPGLPIPTFNAWLHDAFEPVKDAAERALRLAVGAVEDAGAAASVAAGAEGTAQMALKRAAELEARVAALEGGTPAPEPEPEPEPAPFLGFDLAINHGFTDDARELKDGTPFTPLMNRIYNGVITWLNNDHLRTGGNPDRRTEARLAEGHSYHVGRDVMRQVQALTIFFRLTGDQRLLNELTRLQDVAYAAMRTTWVPGASITREPHGERFFPSMLGDKTDSNWGNDDHLHDTTMSLRPWAEIAVARQLAGGGGGGWVEVFAGYERVWSAVNDTRFPASADVPRTYRGAWNLDGGGYTRAARDDWPVNYRPLAHTAHAGATTSLYMGRLLGKPDVGQAGLEKVMDAFFQDEVIYDGAYALWPHGFTTWSSSNPYATPTNYVEYSVLYLLDLYLDGAYDGPWSRFFTALAATYADRVLAGDTFKADLGGGQERSGESDSGRARTLPPNDVAGDRGISIAGLNAFHLLAAWDATGEIREVATREWIDHYSPGGFDAPTGLTVPLAVFMDEAGVFN